MSVIIIATPGAADANSYCTEAEADAYHEARLHADDWLVSGDVKAAALVMATRLLDAYYSWTGDPSTQPQSPKLPRGAYYAWTGAASSEEQALCWPRTGMYTRNGFTIASGEIPTTLKYATAEFARQLIVADRSLDNDVEAQGITSLKAGPVSLSFKDAIIPKVMPDAVQSLLVPSWIIKRGGVGLFTNL